MIPPTFDSKRILINGGVRETNKSPIMVVTQGRGFVVGGIVWFAMSLARLGEAVACRLVVKLMLR